MSGRFESRGTATAPHHVLACEKADVGAVLVEQRRGLQRRLTSTDDGDVPKPLKPVKSPCTAVWQTRSFGNVSKGRGIRSKYVRPMATTTRPRRDDPHPWRA